ncbi:helix-turn-helix domain-containing protein [Pedobacter gandavensis]|uniref:helix-turn-helix domain-containing protein n=1 Tax=Pedobacter gandavensis TaxID=2679963 RepID=UPI0029309F9C|nr:helix-turn-helix domain-containing protein [Pedobacter gandavensis]
MEYRQINESLEEIKFEQAKNAAMLLEAIKEINLAPKSIAEEIERITLPQPEPPDKWLLTEDLMGIFKKTARTIYTWRVQGRIPYTVIGSTVYFNQKDVERLLKEGSKS